MLLGYARVSTEDQDTAAQIAALEAMGCERIFQERASGGRRDRPELLRLLEQLRPGDTLVVWKLDRLSRSLQDLLLILERVEKLGAGFRSITEAVDTTTPAGRAMMQMVGVFAEFERALIRERTAAGLRAARGKGRAGGRPRALNAEQRATALELVETGGRTSADVARIFQVHPTTIGRLVAAARRQQGPRLG